MSNIKVQKVVGFVLVKKIDKTLTYID